MEDPHEILVETLSAMRQQDYADLSNAAFARKKLGISQQMWSYVLRGEKRLGPRSLRVIRERFPHLRPLIVAVLMAPRELERRVA